MMRRTLLCIVGCLGAAIGLGGCHTDMWIQPKLKPQLDNDFFADKSTQRRAVAGTVARSDVRDGSAFYTAQAGGKLVEQLPIPVTAALLERGRRRFEAICASCHGRRGDGAGMVTQRGLILRRAPASYHTDRLRTMPVGYFYTVITNGAGVMFSHANRVEPRDRWAIAAYIRALQLSRHARPEDAPPGALDAAGVTTGTEARP